MCLCNTNCFFNASGPNLILSVRRRSRCKAPLTALNHRLWISFALSDMSGALITWVRRRLHIRCHATDTRIVNSLPFSHWMTPLQLKLNLSQRWSGIIFHWPEIIPPPVWLAQDSGFKLHGLQLQHDSRELGLKQYSSLPGRRWWQRGNSWHRMFGLSTQSWMQFRSFCHSTLPESQ